MLLLLHANGDASPAVAQSAWGQTGDTEEESVSPWGSNLDDPWGAEQSTGGETGNESLDGVPSWAVPHETPTGTWSRDIPSPSETESGYEIPRWDNAEQQRDGRQMNMDTPNDPNKVPIDGGLGLLLVAGAGYAAHRLRKGKDDPNDDVMP